MEPGLKDKLAIFSVRKDEVRPEEVRRNERTRSSAYEEGRKAGFADAQAQAADRSAEIEAALRALPQMVEHLAGEIEASHARAISTAFKSALPRLAESAAADEVMAVILETARADMAGTVQVRSSIAFAQELAPILSQITAQTNIRLVPDSALSGYQIQLSWAGGGGEMDISGMIDRCLGVLSGAVPDDISPTNRAPEETEKW